jgi:hypothetical protein
VLIFLCNARFRPHREVFPELPKSTETQDCLAAATGVFPRDPNDTSPQSLDLALVMAQAAANALTNLARAAIGLGVGATALNSSIYDGASTTSPRILPRRRLLGKNCAR